MCDLIDHHWLVEHMDEYGDYPIEWDDNAKDGAADQALHNCQNHERLDECFVDFFKNKELKSLYMPNLSHEERANFTMNNIWPYIESEIVAQCASIVETRGWKK
jgi:hypothetical protein